MLTGDIRNQIDRICAGPNGQFRTQRQTIELIVEMILRQPPTSSAFSPPSSIAPSAAIHDFKPTLNTKKP